MRTQIDLNKSVSFPIAELSTLGTGVSSLLPVFKEITHKSKSTLPNECLYRIVNYSAGDNLKMAKDRSAWGAMKTATGKSKMVKLVEVKPNGINTFNPLTMMMAATLYSIEKDINEIKDIQKKILDFLHIEKESSIEADVEILTKIATDYKYIWNNELQIASKHKSVNDIQSRALKNINSYKKQINEILSLKKSMIPQGKVKSIYSELENLFKYYRLSLYSFSLSTILDILLSGNQNKEYILKKKDEIESLSSSYREIFNVSSIYLEQIGHSTFESNFIKSIGTAGKVMGKAIGSIPLIKEGSIDEFLQNSGDNLQRNARDMKSKAVKEFATLSNPGTNIFLNKLDDMALIYDRDNQIYFDNENL